MSQITVIVPRIHREYAWPGKTILHEGVEGRGLFMIGRGFVKLTLLCNCSWRFKNFHVDRPELLTPSTRCAHEELQRRIEYLEQPDAARAVETVLAETFGA